jgi:hypothetical protein
MKGQSGVLLVDEGRLRAVRCRGFNRRALFAALVVMLSALTAWGSAAPSVSPLDEAAVLDGCLLPPPEGYEAAPQETRLPQDPIPLSRRELKEVFSPYDPSLWKRGMGWTARNRAYFAAVPLEAREVPADLSALPVVRFNNLEINGERELRWRAHGEWDQWFLHDVTRKIHAVMAIHRQTRRVYFFEYAWRGSILHLKGSRENCYSCHASGPRLVRTYRISKVDAPRLASFNRKLLSYGAADFGTSLDPARLGPALDDGRCMGCHNGRVRGRLYEVHARTLAYYLKEVRNMPPGRPLEEQDADALIRRQHDRWQETRR